MYTANVIKTALLCHYRYQKGALCCTELSYDLGIADVLVLTKNKELIEIEVKISKSDLWHEVESKALKHNVLKEGSLTSAMNLMPNRFYFCVPRELAEEADKLCDELNPKFGVMIFNPCKTSQGYRPEDSFSVYRKSKKLHSKCCDEKATGFIARRLCNDMCKFYKDKFWEL